MRLKYVVNANNKIIEINNEYVAIEKANKGEIFFIPYTSIFAIELLHNINNTN